MSNAAIDHIAKLAIENGAVKVIDGHSFVSWNYLCMVAGMGVMEADPADREKYTGLASFMVEVEKLVAAVEFRSIVDTDAGS